MSLRNAFGDIALDATLQQVRDAITALDAQLEGEDFATQTTLAAAKTVLDNLLLAVDTLETVVGALATEATVGKRYAGGKTAVTADVTALGNTTILTPALGQRLRVYWVSALNDPDEATSPRIIVKFDGAADALYRSYAIAHWEVFTGDVDQPLVVNLSAAGNVAVTVHYEEIG